MLSSDNLSVAEEKKETGDNISTFANATPLPENSEISDSSIPITATSHSRTLKSEEKYSLQQRETKASSYESSTIRNFEESSYQSMMGLSRWFKGKKCGDIDTAVARYPELTFKVTKINKRNKEQERILRLSEHGIFNIKPPDKETSVERWCDVLLCYKIDELTVAIKYTNSLRKYKTKTKQFAENLLNALRDRVNAHQELSRKQLKKRMIEGFDEKEMDTAVPTLKDQEFKHAKSDKVREYVEQILLCETSRVFELKQNLCNFALTDIKRVKELRKYLDQFKYKILDEYRTELKVWIDTTDPDEYKSILWVIESVIESACIPFHLAKINKIFKNQSKNSADLMRKLLLLSRKQQEFFGIDKKLKSKDRWANAVLELVDFPKKQLPSSKMQCLLNTARLIYWEAKRYHRKEVTGDAILSIVIYVMVQASWRNQQIIISEEDQKFIEILINPEALQGERGYYFCVFTAALEFIRNYDGRKIEERFNRIRRLKAYACF